MRGAFSWRPMAPARCVIADSPLERILLFYREGAIVPYGREMNHVGEVPQVLEVVDVYPSPAVPERTYSLYVDDGETANYMSGAFGFVDIAYRLTGAEEPGAGYPVEAAAGRGSVANITVDARDEHYPCALPLGVVRVWGCETRPLEVLAGGKVLPEAANASDVLGGQRGYFMDAKMHQLYVGVHGPAKDVRLTVVWPTAPQAEA